MGTHYDCAHGCSMFTQQKKEKKMEFEDDKIIFKSRYEVALLQNICEGFLALSVSIGENDERELAKKLSKALEAIYILIGKE